MSGYSGELQLPGWRLITRRPASRRGQRCPWECAVLAAKMILAILPCLLAVTITSFIIAVQIVFSILPCWVCT